MAHLCRALCLALSLGLAAPALADTSDVAAPSDEGFPGTLSINATYTSDYRFRGVSQTKESWAPQWGMDWSHESGLFVGMWGSRINFGGDEWVEQDIYAGFAGSVGRLSYDLSACYFYYPREGSLNYWEYIANTSLDLGFASLKLGGVYSPDYLNFLGDGYYVSTGLEIPLPLDLPYGVSLSLDGTIGLTKTEEVIFEDDDYVDWNIGLVLSLPRGLSLDLRYVDTDVDDVDDADRSFVAGLGVEWSFD